MVLQGNICPLSSAHNSLCYINFAIILQSSPGESRNVSSLLIPVGLFSVRCAMWNQHRSHLTLGERFECGTATTACRLCIVSCSASSLCSCGAHFSLLLSFRHPCKSLLLTRLLRDLQGNLCFFYFPLHHPFFPLHHPLNSSSPCCDSARNQSCFFVPQLWCK